MDLQCPLDGRWYEVVLSVPNNANFEFGWNSMEFYSLKSGKLVVTNKK